MSKKNSIPTRVFLPEDKIPTRYYNLLADMPNKPAVYLHPATFEPCKPSDMLPIFAPALIEQEFSNERYIDIPEEVLHYYRMYRPSPLHRAYQLEKALDTPARIYYKYEGQNTSGSHKLNTAIPQVYYNKIAGIKALTTETGAGQWGTALAIAANFFDMPIEVFMVKCSTQQKPYRKTIIETYGAKVIASPSDTTQAGRSILEQDPECSGSLGMAISEALEKAAQSESTRYVLGSVLNHVLLHQSIIGQEAQEQFTMIDETPDIVIGCAGGGSNLGGMISPFVRNNLAGKAHTRIIAVEPAACPSLTKGRFAYDYGDAAKLCPLCKMYTLGHGFVPASIHAGGLRYHGMSPILSQLYHDGLIEARAEKQTRVFEAAMLFAKTEALLPAPESAHAICAAIDEAKKCKESGEEKVITFLLSGHGNFDLGAYENYLRGNTIDAEYTDEMREIGFASLPKID